MIQYEWSARDSDHLETTNSDRVNVTLLREIRSSTDCRALRGLVMATLGRLGRAQIGDHATRVVGRARNGKE